MVLFIVERSANFEHFSFFTIKPSLGYLIRDVISSELYLILFVKMKQKKEKGFNILFPFVMFFFKIVWIDIRNLFESIMFFS